MTSVITGRVQCRYHQQMMPCCRQSPPLVSETTTEAWSNARAGAGRLSTEAPSSPPITQASSTESPAVPKDSFQPASEQRLRSVCPGHSGIGLGKSTGRPTNCLADIQNKTQKTKPFHAAPLPSRGPPPTWLWHPPLPWMCPQPLSQASQPLKDWTLERG